MTRLYFVRHAEPNFDNHNDRLRELSQKGLEDRRLVTEYLADKSVDAVISSPLKRAIDTVSDFAKTYRHEIKVVEDFRERPWIVCFSFLGRQCVKIESYNIFTKQGEEIL